MFEIFVIALLIVVIKMLFTINNNICKIGNKMGISDKD